MRVSAFSAPAGEGDNEDWVSAAPGLIVVLDGATVRTDTGCTHGVSWYVARLGAAVSRCSGTLDTPLSTALGLAIRHVAGEHPACDLRHPGTPAAATAVLRTRDDVLEYLVLGDVTVVLDTAGDPRVVTDDRVDGTATVQRERADRWPIGSPEKRAALVEMKHAELAARNRTGGYWVAAADPGVVTCAVTGSIPLEGLRRAAVLSDGAARLVRPFGLLDWRGLLDLLDEAGPREAVRRVRAAEAADPEGRRYPRNKRRDDATIVYASH